MDAKKNTRTERHRKQQRGKHDYFCFCAQEPQSSLKFRPSQQLQHPKH